MILNLLLFLFFEIFCNLIQQTPEFKGGQRNLTMFISHNLIYPEYAKQNCLQGTVSVSFKLTKEGRIYNSSIHKGLGIDLDDEALRIVRLTRGKWIVPSTHDTSAFLILPVNFSLKEYDCEEVTITTISEAIAAYKAREGLTKVIYNFYDIIYPKGTYSKSEESSIQNLKSQLGYDEKYITSLLKTAERKIKQKDTESACEDFHIIRKLGSDKADKLIEKNCK